MKGRGYKHIFATVLYVFVANEKKQHENNNNNTL